MSTLPSAVTFGVANEAPPNKSSTLSPATAKDPVVGNVTRNTVLAASAAFKTTSVKSVLPCSATEGAAGKMSSTTVIEKTFSKLPVPSLVRKRTE